MRRCLNAAVNAGFAACQRSADLTLDDIDAIWLAWLGFPRWKGGLIYHARARGLEAAVAELKADAARRNTAGAPCDGLVAAAKDGETSLDLAIGE